MDSAILSNIFEEYQRLKREAVDSEYDNDAPMLLYLGEYPLHESTIGQVLCIVIPSGDALDLMSAIAHAMARAFIPYWAALCSDAYVAKAEDGPDRMSRQIGLQELFENDDGSVSEGLTITAADHEGMVYVSTREYWYDDDGDIWFRDEEGPLIDDDDTSGPMLDVLKDVTSLWGKTQAEVIAAILERTIEMN